MALRRKPFLQGEFYHVFTRGIDKRQTFLDPEDMGRFFLGMNAFNTLDPIGSIYEDHFRKNPLRDKQQKTAKIVKKIRRDKLVNFICYCINPNHYHFILEQLVEDGIKKFMQRIGTGYTKFFNNKYKRTGSLFQTPFKAVHVDSNEYLLHLSAYVNLNDRVHQLGSVASKLVRSSWNEYIGKSKDSFCEKDIILKQFKSSKEYKKFAEGALEWIRENKEAEKYLLE